MKTIRKQIETMELSLYGSTVAGEDEGEDFEGEWDEEEVTTSRFCFDDPPHIRVREICFDFITGWLLCH